MMRSQCPQVWGERLDKCDYTDFGQSPYAGARCGQWSAAATLGSSFTVFQLENWARVDDRQVGWLLQPDIERLQWSREKAELCGAVGAQAPAQVFLPITSVDENSHTVTVAGSYAALGVAGKRFRIHAPPGVETYGENAGLLSKWTSASSSRCLYAGYRFESPLAGHREPATSTTAGSIINRQSGKNYSGLHYTLHRHYDPSLMRFTSADPIASRANLFAYCDNNPHGSYDPDGLESAMGFMRFMTCGKNPLVNYLYKMEATLEGAAFDIVDCITLRQRYDDSHREAMLWKHEQQGTSQSYRWGGIVGGGTYVAVAAIATGGYAASGLSGGFAAYGGSAYVGGTALTGEIIAGGVGGWVGGEVGSLMLNGRGQTNAEAAFSIGSGALFGGVGRYVSAPRSLNLTPSAGRPAPTSMQVGRQVEAERLAALGKIKNTAIWRPSQADMDSAAFKVIVGNPKFTAGGLPKGTIFDSTNGGFLEIKAGASPLTSSYQLRLQVYRSLKENGAMKLHTTRPINPTFRRYLERWGVTIDNHSPSGN